MISEKSFTYVKGNSSGTLEVVVLLFTDLLLIVRAKRQDLFILQKPPLPYESVVFLDKPDSDIGKKSFQIIHLQQEIYAFEAPTLYDKKIWLREAESLRISFCQLYYEAEVARGRIFDSEIDAEESEDQLIRNGTLKGQSESLIKSSMRRSVSGGSISLRRLQEGETKKDSIQLLKGSSHEEVLARALSDESLNGDASGSLTRKGKKIMSFMPSSAQTKVEGIPGRARQPSSDSQHSPLAKFREEPLKEESKFAALSSKITGIGSGSLREWGNMIKRTKSRSGNAATANNSTSNHLAAENPPKKTSIDFEDAFVS